MITRGASPWYDEALVSLGRSGLSYEIQLCRGDFPLQRFEAHQSSRYVAMLDDDDMIVPGAFEACVEAMRATGSGVAFTYEVQIDERGEELGVNRGAGTLRELCMSPQAIHHLAVVRGDLIEPARSIALRYGVAVEWVIKVYAALHYGVVKVPIVGYKWRRHTNGRSAHTADEYAKLMPDLRRLFCSWMVANGPIEHFVPGRSPAPDAACAA